MSQSSSRLRGALVVLGALLLMRTYSMLGDPVRAWTATLSTTRAEREMQISLISRGPEVAKQLDAALSAMRARQHEYLRPVHGQRPEETLASLVLSAADSAGFVIESVTPEQSPPAEHAMAARLARVVIGGSGSLSDICYWLSSVESGAPRLSVTSIELSRQGSASEDMLRVRATIIGLIEPQFAVVASRSNEP